MGNEIEGPLVEIGSRSVFGNSPPRIRVLAHLQGIEPVSGRAYSNFRGSRREGVGCRCATRFRVTNRDFEHRKCRSAILHSLFKARRVTFHE